MLKKGKKRRLCNLLTCKKIGLIFVYFANGFCGETRRFFLPKPNRKVKNIYHSKIKEKIPLIFNIFLVFMSKYN